MASGRKEARANAGATTAADIARYGIGGGPGRAASAAATVRGRFSLEETDAAMAGEKTSLRRKVVECAVALAVLAFLSLGLTGAAPLEKPEYFCSTYTVFAPWEVAYAIWMHLYNLVGSVTHLYAPLTFEQSAQIPAYGAVIARAGVIGITLVCAVLLSVAGALYQAVFRNPIAGPGMLGVGSGVSLGVMLLVYTVGAAATGSLALRYGLCYGLGSAILVFVILAGRRLSGRGRPFDIVTMLLLGSILSQLIGFVVSYMTLFVMDPDAYNLYYALMQMLQVDTSWISWVCLGAATVVSLAPIWYLRFKMNALAFDEQEVRLMGIDPLRLRAVALISGAVMVLAAQIHCGAVGTVSLIVPFLARSWFGCEFRKQLVGNLCIGTILLLACRDIADLIPFVGGGVGIGAVVSVVAMPLFLFIVAKHMRGWE